MRSKEKGNDRKTPPGANAETQNVGPARTQTPLDLDTDRRRFLKTLGQGAAGIAVGGALAPWLARSARADTAASIDTATTTGTLARPDSSPASAVAGKPYDLATVKGDDPAGNARRAVEALGGMKRFVSKGDVVVVKPNIGWDRTPEQAANTNPEVVAALVAMALDAGAARVKVFDHTCQNPRSCYVRSGIEEAARAAGAQVIPFDRARCKTVAIPNAEFLTEWPVFPDILECDVVVNCPIAKVHGGSRLTLAMKNLMGVVGGNRGHWHRNLHTAIAEFLGLVNPQLNVIDAWRILVANGPQGGSLDDVRLVKTCIASPDAVAADARATALFDLKPEDIEHIVLGAKMGYGEIDLAKVNSVEIG